MKISLVHSSSFYLLKIGHHVSEITNPSTIG